MEGMIKICGLWQKKTKSGESMLSGGLSFGSNIVILKNKFKQKDTEPDFNLFISAKEKKENGFNDKLPEVIY